MRLDLSLQEAIRIVMKKQQNKKLLKKILSSAATALLVITVCLCLFVVVQVLGKGYVSFGKYSFFRVVTPSMEPNLMVGEIILTKDVPIEEVQMEDIVSFRSQSADMFGTIITHRVVDIDRAEDGQRRLLTKGDANLSVDGRYVLESNLVGKVVWSSGDSAISSLLSFVSGRYGFFACIVLPSVLILALVLSSSVKTIKQDMKKLVMSVEEQDKAQLADVKSEVISSQEYDQMCQRIREELIEELKASEDTQPKTE